MIYDSPATMKAALDEYVIGQDSAKWALANAFFMYEMRLHHLYKGMNIQHKSHVLLVGPSGSGKTFLARVLAEQVDMALIVVDTSTIARPGWTGNSVYDAINLERTRLGLSDTTPAIVLLDEIDKIAVQGRGTNAEVNEGIQSSLLALLDGKSYCEQPSSMRPVTVVNSDLYFIIAAGAFEGLKQVQNVSNDVKRALVNQGIKIELLNRFVAISTLTALSEDELYKILIESPQSALNFYKEIFAMCEIDLKLSDIEEHQVKQSFKSGEARSLNAVLFETLAPRLQALEQCTLLLGNDPTIFPDTRT